MALGVSVCGMCSIIANSRCSHRQGPLLCLYSHHPCRRGQLSCCFITLLPNFITTTPNLLIQKPRSISCLLSHTSSTIAPICHGQLLHVTWQRLLCIANVFRERPRVDALRIRRRLYGPKPEPPNGQPCILMLR